MNELIAGRPGSGGADDSRRAAHRDSEAVGESVRERADQAFIDAVTDCDDERALPPPPAASRLVDEVR